MKMKSKNNWTMRAAVLMFALVLITSSFVGGTFAKYVTSGGAMDNARVAIFGVEINAQGAMFKTEYAKNPASAELAATNSVVTSETNKKVVAPGTEGDLVSANITGKPEVAVKVEYKPELTLTNWTLVGGEEYCPIVFTVNGRTYGMTGMQPKTGALDVTATSISDLKAKVETAIKSYSKVYKANENLGEATRATGTDNVKVSWYWAFDGNNDENDTYLGNQAAAGNAAEVNLNITTTVTQID